MLQQVIVLPSKSSVLATADDIGAVVTSLTQISQLYSCFQYIEDAILLSLNPAKMALIPVAQAVDGELKMTIYQYLRRFAPKWKDIP
eukprot:1936655-Karenia_brevis.AAC.1